MTSETTLTGWNDASFSAWIADKILDEERPYNVCRPFFRYEGPQKSAAMQFPIQADPGVATGGYTEGTGLSNTALTTDNATATATANGQMATVTLEVQETSKVPMPSQAIAVLGRSVAERFETDATALLDDFANTSGAAGVATTYAVLLDAVNKLEQRDQVGSPVGVLDPIQIGSVRQDLGTSGAAALARDDSVSSTGNLSATLSGMALSGLAGADWYQTSLVTSSGGGVFLKGVALGLYEIRPPRPDSINVPSMPGIQLVCTSRYGMVEIRDRAGQTIVSS